MTATDKLKQIHANAICKKRICFHCFFFGPAHVVVPEDWAELALLKFAEALGKDVEKEDQNRSSKTEDKAIMTSCVDL